MGRFDPAAIRTATVLVCNDRSSFPQAISENSISRFFVSSSFEQTIMPVDQLSLVIRRSLRVSRSPINAATFGGWSAGQFGCGSISSITYNPPGLSRASVCSRCVYLPGQVSAKIKSNDCPSSP